MSNVRERECFSFTTYTLFLKIQLHRQCASHLNIGIKALVYKLAHLLDDSSTLLYYKRLNHKSRLRQRFVS